MNEVIETLDRLIHVGAMIGLNILVWGCVIIAAAAVVAVCLKTIKGELFW